MRAQSTSRLALARTGGRANRRISARGPHNVQPPAHKLERAAGKDATFWKSNEKGLWRVLTVLGVLYGPARRAQRLDPTRAADAGAAVTAVLADRGRLLAG